MICETCNGIGTVFRDCADWAGEHITRHEPCPDCSDDGVTGIREADTKEWREELKEWRR